MFLCYLHYPSLYEMFAQTEVSAGFMYGRWILQRQSCNKIVKNGGSSSTCVCTHKCKRWSAIEPDELDLARSVTRGCSEAILPFKPPVVKSAWRPVCFSWILFLLKLPGWREALSWECCSTCEVGCVCVRALGKYMCASEQLARLRLCRRIKRMFGGADVQHPSLSFFRWRVCSEGSAPVEGSSRQPGGTLRRKR